MKTVDGGRNWALQKDQATVREFFVHDETYVFGVGKNSILRSADGGETWTETAPADDRIVDLRAVHFIDSVRGWVVGDGREEVIDGRTIEWTVVLSTVDGGASWSVREFAYETTGLGAAAEPVETAIPFSQ